MRLDALRSIPVALLFAACGGVVTGADGELQRDTDSAAGGALFTHATFDGNGRTCATCHPSALGQSGTVSPSEAQARFAANPNDPLFRWDGADTLGGNTFNRVQQHATILVTIPLPANVSIVGSSQRSVTFARGIPTTMNTPALDPVLMYDGRAPNTAAQAQAAIAAHFQSSGGTAGQLAAIASFEDTLFNRGVTQDYYYNHDEPQLPAGNTDSEKRGAALFQSFRCTSCHGGPMLNTITELGIPFGETPGGRFTDIAVSEFNTLGNPVYTFAFANADGSTTNVTTPDPGRALITGNPADANRFKIPSLWGIKDTAPYFHDNSADTLEDVMAHYAAFFSLAGVPLTATDQADLVNYLKLL